MHEFEVIKELGSGSFGRVLKVRRKDDVSFLAMKTIKMMQLTPKEKDNALNEVRLLASIDSPNVIKYKGAFFQECGNILSIVMEYADGGDLAGLIEKKQAKNQKFQQNFIWKVAYDILKGLKFLHHSNIIHRDVKSANVFFVNGVAKLGDLNVSKVMEGNFATTQTGTPYYTSPEIWQGKKYNANCDIWSLGCLLYQLCSLRPPFIAKDFPGLMKRVTSGYYDPIPSRYSKKLSTLIRRCLTIDLVKRPSAAELLQTDVFLMMDAPDQGQIQLLDTIRCPRVLKLLNKQLPQDQYTEKKPKTLKIIGGDSDTERSMESHQNGQQHRSMKKVGSERNIRILSIEKKGVQINSPKMIINPNPNPNHHDNNFNINEDRRRYMNQQVSQDRNQNLPPRIPAIPSNKVIPCQNVINSPGGYLKLPKVASYKILN